MWGQFQHQRQRLLLFRRYFRMMRTHASARRPLCGHNTNSWGHIALHWTYDVLCPHEMPWLWLVFPLLFSGRRKNVHPETNHTMVWSLQKPQNIFLFLYGDHALWFRLIVMLLHLHELPWELPNKLDGSLISLWSGKAWKDNSPTINYSSICRIQPNFVYRKQLERLSRHAEEPHSSFIIHRLVALP